MTGAQADLVPTVTPMLITERYHADSHRRWWKAPSAEYEWLLFQ
jgi:hypothetical protein